MSVALPSTVVCRTEEAMTIFRGDPWKRTPDFRVKRKVSLRDVLIPLSREEKVVTGVLITLALVATFVVLTWGWTW